MSAPFDFGGRPVPPALRAPLDPDSETRLRDMPVAPYDPIYELPAGRLRTFQAGRLDVIDHGRHTGVSLPILAYVLDAVGGTFAVDTGLASRWARPEGQPHVAPDDSPSAGTPYLPGLPGPTLAVQLQSLGLAPDRLVCTHLHEDHAGGAAELGLTLEASGAELQRLAAPDAEANGYPVGDLEGVPTRAIELDPSRPLGPFPATAELAAGVIAVDTAGHTPGSISVLACIGPAWALICGDAVYPRLDQADSPAFLGMLRIRRALEDLGGLRVFPAHDTVVLRSGAAEGWLGDDPREPKVV